MVVDVTHRCNMACRNCYIPNRTIPDLDAEWLAGILARLPRRRFVRLVGAEPTVRKDLCRLIRDVRRSGHHPVVMTNGLKLTKPGYVRELKDAGVQIVYLSVNGAFDDDLYEAIDDLRCAEPKRQALENLCEERVFVSLGMILVRGVNEHAPRRVLEFAADHTNIREFHLRSIGPMGRYMDRTPFTLDEMVRIFAANADIRVESLHPHYLTSTSFDFKFGSRLRVQITQWPDLGSTSRGRLTPEGTLQPAFEHIMANEGGY